jgi:nucleoside-diphosphate-sugar epimerase
LKCFVRPSANTDRLTGLLAEHPDRRVEIVRGNLLSRRDAERAVGGVRIVCHLAAGMDKSFAGAFMNSVVTTRNLLDAVVSGSELKRFVHVSSFAVYSGERLKRGAVLDETCPLEDPPHRRGEAYAYSKIRQEALLGEYRRRHALGSVTLRPGAVYGPGKPSITGRVGIDTFGVYLHLGGSIELPLSYVDNCADAIALAGLVPGVDGEVFNVVDDDLPRSRDFLRLYKQNVRRFPSIPVPYAASYALSAAWEKYSEWSEGQLPPTFSRSRSAAEWKGHRYSNAKLKARLGWMPRVGTAEGLERYFAYARSAAA